MNILPACVRCAAKYSTCCRTEPAVAHLCFPLSEAEWQRIAPHAAEACGRPGRTQEENTEAFAQAMKRLFPGYAARVAELFPVPGLRWRLVTTPEGACVFLGPEGCRLPRSVRPWYCLLFPIWVQNGRLDAFDAKECVVCEENRTLPGVLAAVGLTEEEAKALAAALYKDWGLG